MGRKELSNRKSGADFGAGVLEASEADDRQRGSFLGTAVDLIATTLIGSGFLTCSLVDMCAK